MAMIDEIKKEIFCSMKFSDTTIAGIKETEAVSYTHLTLPTICSV